MASPSPMRCAHALALLVTSASMRATAMPRPLASGLPPPAPAAALAEKLVEISFDIVPWRRSEGAELSPFARRLMPSSAPDELAALISTVDPAAVMEQSGSTTSVSITSPTSEEVLRILHSKRFTDAVGMQSRRLVHLHVRYLEPPSPPAHPSPVPPPPPPPRPPPPPAVRRPLFSVIGGGCAVAGGCVSSLGFPLAYRGQASCSIHVDHAVTVKVGAGFGVESCCDNLVVGGVDTESADEVPTTLAGGTVITWRADGSGGGKGWQLCFDAAPVDFSTRWLRLLETPNGRLRALLVLAFVVVALAACAWRKRSKSMPEAARDLDDKEAEPPLHTVAPFKCERPLIATAVNRGSMLPTPPPTATRTPRRWKLKRRVEPRRAVAAHTLVRRAQVAASESELDVDGISAASRASSTHHFYSIRGPASTTSSAQEGSCDTDRPVYRSAAAALHALKIHTSAREVPFGAAAARGETEPRWLVLAKALARRALCLPPVDDPRDGRRQTLV